LPDPVPLRVFLDSNVVFSASRDERSRFLKLWSLRSVRLVVSPYGIGEVIRNVRSPEHSARLSSLLVPMEIVSDSDVRLIPPHIVLVAKDQQILAAAIGASADYLITGDKAHFGHLYGTRLSGVFVITPADFLALYEDRLPQ